MTISAARKTIFISGGAGGIGLATAKLFTSKGWFVGLGDIDQAGLAAAVSALGTDNAMGVALDVRHPADWTSALGAFEKVTNGRLDALMNNAGIGRYGWFEDIAPDEANLEIDINIKGVINGAYASLEALKRTPGSTLINVSSCAGLYGASKLAVYAATKFAVRGLSESLDIEFSRLGVKVRCIMPWFVETPILDAGARGTNEAIRDVLKGANFPVYTVEEAAQVVWDSIEAPGLHHLVGKRAKDLRFAARFFPNGIRKQMKAGLAAT